MKDFKAHDNQGMPPSKHSLIAIDTDASACAHQCTKGKLMSSFSESDLTNSLHCIDFKVIFVLVNSSF